MWRKLRKREWFRSNIFKPTFERQQAWQLLYDLASRTRASFEAAKFVRSIRLRVGQFYALVRLSNCLEQPSRGHVRRLLQQACKFRKLMWPKARAVLQLPFLAHDEFAKEVKSFLKQLVLKYKSILLSFHLPPVNILEQPHQTLKGLHEIPGIGSASSRLFG